MTLDLLCDAIRYRTLLAFEYDGHARVVAPYCHGETGSGEALRAVQVGGSSTSGGFGFGKLWMVVRMKNVRAVLEAFEPNDPHYNPDDTAMKTIHCRIEVSRVVPSRREV
jgi:hypothetical protein